MTLADFASRLRERAGRIVANRQSDATLYSVLVGCMELAERCSTPEDEQTLRKLAGELPLPASKKRHYIEKGSDIYQLVSRYIFHGDVSSANINRYAICLRQAAQRQINSAALGEWLANNGGVNALYLRRPLLRTTVLTKCLRLTSQIEAPKDKPFTLTLRRTPENEYEVLT